MAKFRALQVSFWEDEKVIEEMTPEDKLFMIYLLTNPLTTQCGVYRITKKQIAFHLGYSMETVNSLMDRFIKHHELIMYNPETREIGFKNWGKYNYFKGGKPVYDLVKKELNEVKDKDILRWIYDAYINSTDSPNQEIANIISAFLDGTTRGTYRDTTRGTTGGQKEKEKETEKEKEKETTLVRLNQDILYRIIDTWNALGVNKISRLLKSQNRYTLLRQRIKENGIDEFFKVMESIGDSPFLKGENQNGWVITFDWFVKPSNFIKVMEGNYLDKAIKGGSNNGKHERAVNETDWDRREIEKARQLVEQQGFADYSDIDF